MQWLKRLFRVASAGTAHGNGKLRARIQMGLNHPDNQRMDVTAAVEGFRGAHESKIEGTPELTFSSHGSVIGITLVVADAEEAKALNDDLKRRTAAAGVLWT
jgi:hypothetical protein